MKMNSPMLPPGFRFHPTDQELLIHYLKNKRSSSPNPVVSIIADVDIYKFNPWELPGKAWFGESEWFFFSPRDRKYPNGARPNRAAASGYWKASGTDKPIMSSSGAKCLGVKKALAFYQGRPPQGIKTSWMMLEYRLIDDTLQSPRQRGSMRLDDWVLCRVRQKSKISQHIKEDNKFNCSISPFASGCLQGQDPMEGLQAYNLLLPEGAGGEQGQATFQTESPEYSAHLSDFDSNPISDMVSSNREAFESIKKILSVVDLEELAPPLPPNSSSTTTTTTSAPNPPCFAEFIIYSNSAM